jgi:hypothetical protein
MTEEERREQKICCQRDASAALVQFGATPMSPLPYA